MASEEVNLLNLQHADTINASENWTDQLKHDDNKSNSQSCCTPRVWFAIGIFFVSISIGGLLQYSMFGTPISTTNTVKPEMEAQIHKDLSNLPSNVSNILTPHQAHNTPTPSTKKVSKDQEYNPNMQLIEDTKKAEISTAIIDEQFVATKRVIENLDESEAKKLNIKVTRMTVNQKEKDFSIVEDGPYYGAYSFNYKYPIDNKQYQTNEMRKTCFHIKLDEGKIDHIIIDIKFVKFKLENGFDRILIRTFNDSMVDLPISYSGNLWNISQMYLLEQTTSRSVCIEFQSDDSFVDDGYEYNLNIYYDVCKWSPYSECYMENLIGQKWSRGPMWNGKCGVGVMSMNRTETPISDLKLSGEAVLQCSNKNMLQINGPEYCIKRKCVSFDNENDPDWPPIKMPGHAWFKPIEYYNGRGRLDPTLPDPFRIYRSDKNHLMDGNKVDLIKLEEKLTSLAAQIVSEHYDENVLKFAIGDRDHRDTHAEYLGARMLNSLINGKPFVFATVGDSVTSGHDNMFISTYAMQAQARLRPFFVEVGNKGATFSARNIGEGGGPDDYSQAPVARSMATEVFPSVWDELNEIIHTTGNYDTWHRYGGLPIQKIDLVLWEQYFVGGGRRDTVELDIRQFAAMNALWGALVPNRGVQVKDTCKDFQQMMDHLPSWTNADKYGGKLGPIVPLYVDKMGFMLVFPRYGMQAGCEIVVNNNVTATGKKSDDGIPNVCCLPDGQKYSYVGFWMRSNWHPNSRGNRVNSDMVTYWLLNSAITFLTKYKETMNKFSSLKEFDNFLKLKSGNWGREMIDSIKHERYEEFVEPHYCGKNTSTPYCQSIPFGISNQSPFIYNTHGYLNEYILFTPTKDTKNLKEYLTYIGWDFDEPSRHMISEKHGMEGLLDEKGQRLKPNSKFYKNKFAQWKKSADSDDWDEFEKYLISNGYYLQVVVKIPKYGAGHINVYGGHTGWYCNPSNIANKVMHVYANTLANIKRNKNDLGVLLKPSDVTGDPQCTFTNLQPDTKYVVSYVPYNMNADFSFTVMFIAAY